MNSQKSAAQGAANTLSDQTKSGADSSTSPFHSTTAQPRAQAPSGAMGAGHDLGGPWVGQRPGLVPSPTEQLSTER